MRIAVIDTGSYSVRLTVAEVKDSRLNILLEKGYITSLGSGVKKEGKLRSDRIEETLRVLEDYRREIDKLGVDRVVVVATEALRRARNAEEFIELVRKRTGFEVRILSPEEEGRLAFLATAYSLRPEGYFVVVDQGGGSTEFAFGRDLKPQEVISLPFGIVDLTERFLRHDPPLEEELLSLRAFVRDRVLELKRNVDDMIGLGGTITTVAALEYGVHPYDPLKIHGREISLSALKRWLGELVRLTSAERSRKFRQIEDRRAEVIPAGVAMFVEIMEVFERERIKVGDWGVKHGLIVSCALGASV